MSQLLKYLAVFHAEGEEEEEGEALMFLPEAEPEERSLKEELPRFLTPLPW